MKSTLNVIGLMLGLITCFIANSSVTFKSNSVLYIKRGNIVFYIKNDSQSKKPVNIKITINAITIADSLYEYNPIADLYDSKSLYLPYGKYKLIVNVDNDRLIETKWIVINSLKTRISTGYVYRKFDAVDIEDFEYERRNSPTAQKDSINVSNLYHNLIFINVRKGNAMTYYKHTPKKIN